MRAASLASVIAGVTLSAGAATAQPCARPTDASGVRGYGYGAATVSAFGNDRVLVWYATSGPHAIRTTSSRADGVPDEVADAAAVTGDALDRYAAMGYRAPLSDALAPACGSNGGDGRLDIYLVNMIGADGVTIGEPGRCQTAAGALRCAGFILAQARFGTPYATPAVGLRTVLPHETFHAVQNAYDVEIDRFWAEGTAQWAAETLNPTLTDLERFLPSFFSQTSRSLDAPPNGVASAFLYGAAIWPVFLAERHGAAVVKDILEAEGQGGVSAIAAADTVLRARGTSVAAAFALFSAWNAAAGHAAAVGGYANGAAYPQVMTTPLGPDEVADGVTAGLASFFYRAHSDVSAVVTLETDPARNAGTLVPIEGGSLRVDLAKSLPASFQGDAVVVVSGTTASKTDAPYTLSIGGPAGGCSVAGRRADPAALGAALGAIAIALARRRRGPRARLRMVALFLSPLACAARPAAHGPVAVAPVAGACDPARDRAAILAMAGEYEVQFSFQETAALTAGYALRAPYDADGAELVLVVDEGPTRVALQHLLMLEHQGKSTIVKHWRQDWTFEARDLLEYRGGTRWTRRQLAPGEERCTWRQAVFEVNDGPRYQGVGRWVHAAGVSSWTSNETWRPLPRREHTTRDDYDVIVGVNRHTVTADGWLHEQDNTKLVLRDAPRALARERGVNRYQRSKAHDFGPARRYWERTGAFWGDVRAAWADVIDTHAEVILSSDEGHKPLSTELAALMERGTASLPYERGALEQSIAATIAAHLLTPGSATAGLSAHTPRRP